VRDEGTDGHDGGCFRDCEMQKKIAQEMGFLTEKDVAQLFIVLKSTLHSWRRQGTVPTYADAGDCLFYNLWGVSAFLMARVEGYHSGQGECA
jgi:hypothetical protein